LELDIQLKTLKCQGLSQTVWLYICKVFREWFDYDASYNVLMSLLVGLELVFGIGSLCSDFVCDDLTWSRRGWTIFLQDGLR